MKDSIVKSAMIKFLYDSFLRFAKEMNAILMKLDECKSLATQLELRKQLLSLKLQWCNPVLTKDLSILTDLMEPCAHHNPGKIK